MKKLSLVFLLSLSLSLQANPLNGLLSRSTDNISSFFKSASTRMNAHFGEDTTIALDGYASEASKACREKWQLLTAWGIRQSAFAHQKYSDLQERMHDSYGVFKARSVDSLKQADAYCQVTHDKAKKLYADWGTLTPVKQNMIVFGAGAGLGGLFVRRPIKIAALASALTISYVVGKDIWTEFKAQKAVECKAEEEASTGVQDKSDSE